MTALGGSRVQEAKQPVSNRKVDDEGHLLKRNAPNGSLTDCSANADDAEMVMDVHQPKSQLLMISRPIVVGAYQVRSWALDEAMPACTSSASTVQVRDYMAMRSSNAEGESPSAAPTSLLSVEVPSGAAHHPHTTVAA